MLSIKNALIINPLTAPQPVLEWAIRDLLEKADCLWQYNISVVKKRRWHYLVLKPFAAMRASETEILVSGQPMLFSILKHTGELNCTPVADLDLNIEEMWSLSDFTNYLTDYYEFVATNPSYGQLRACYVWPNRVIVKVEFSDEEGSSMGEHALGELAFKDIRNNRTDPFRKDANQYIPQDADVLNRIIFHIRDTKLWTHLIRPGTDRRTSNVITYTEAKDLRILRVDSLYHIAVINIVDRLREQGRLAGELLMSATFAEELPPYEESQLKFKFAEVEEPSKKTFKEKMSNWLDKQW